MHPDRESLKGNRKYYLEEAEQELDVQGQLARIREGYAVLKPKEVLCNDATYYVLIQVHEGRSMPETA